MVTSKGWYLLLGRASKGWYHAATCVASDEMVAMPPTSSLHLPYISPRSPLGSCRSISTLRGERPDGGHAADGDTKEDGSGPGPGLRAGGRYRDRGRGTRAGTGTEG